MDDTSPAGPTLSLKVIGLLLVFAGMNSVCGMAVAPFLDHLHFDLGFLMIPVGIGLLRLHGGARKLLLFLYYLTFGMMVVVLPVVLGLRIFGPPDSGWSRAGDWEVYGKFICRLPWWLSTAISVTALVVFVWIFVVLQRRATRRLFQAAAEGSVRLSRGLRVGVILALLLGVVPTVGAVYVRTHFAASDHQESRVPRTAWRNSPGATAGGGWPTSSTTVSTVPRKRRPSPSVRWWAVS